MGNRVTTALDKWGLNPRKLSQKRSTRKSHKTAPPAVPHHQTIDPHIYESVSAEPKYAIVNKKKKTTTESDGLHYAEIQVLQSESTSKQRTTPTKDSSTEYATIDFLRGAKPKESAEPADILIPPGQLHNLMVKSKKRRSDSSHRGSRGLSK
ncbi:hypothetical protein Q7C36_022820 [Tachysurus vachellii]|uniref:Uncharacterized protein n=1 Tax=Tachysurus vachellii TaxID=175792 RepID=A0AA88J140_TACVA|nr:uncharacterized protein zgc:193711 [Tachysurus vachellii]KAK2816549.1 hypothetical protein Q7C36_022820 [Tachysurus vachellii]